MTRRHHYCTITICSKYLKARERCSRSDSGRPRSSSSAQCERSRRKKGRAATSKAAQRKKVDTQRPGAQLAFRFHFANGRSSFCNTHKTRLMCDGKPFIIFCFFIDHRLVVERESLLCVPSRQTIVCSAAQRPGDSRRTQKRSEAHSLPGHLHILTCKCIV